MGRRSRKRRDPARATPARRDAMKRGSARGEARNEAIRQSLEPLGPGERPGAVTVAAIVAALLAAANVGLMFAGVEIRGENPAAGGVILFGAMMLVAAWGMWQAKYWAVLGFQALLALIILAFALRTVFASSVGAAAIGLSVVVLAGWLFWKLIRALARLQMPERRPRQSDV